MSILRFINSEEWKNIKSNFRDYKFEKSKWRFFKLDYYSIGSNGSKNMVVQKYFKIKHLKKENIKNIVYFNLINYLFILYIDQ